MQGNLFRYAYLHQPHKVASKKCIFKESGKRFGPSEKDGITDIPHLTLSFQYRRFFKLKKMYTYSQACLHINTYTQTHAYVIRLTGCWACIIIFYIRRCCQYPINSPLLNTHLPIITDGFTSQEPAALSLKTLSAPGYMYSLYIELPRWVMDLKPWELLSASDGPELIEKYINSLPCDSPRIPQQDGALVTQRGTWFIKTPSVGHLPFPVSLPQSLPVCFMRSPLK